MKIPLPVRDWLFIDASIDNTVAIAAQDGDERTAAEGYAIRETGWKAARGHPKAAEGFGGWPPEDEDLTMDLPAEAWGFIVSQLRRWDGVDALTSPRPEGAPESRFIVIARFLEEHLG